MLLGIYNMPTHLDQRQLPLTGKPHRAVDITGPALSSPTTLDQPTISQALAALLLPEE